MKAQRTEAGGRISKGDDTGDGAVFLWGVKFQRFGVWISFGLPCGPPKICIHTLTKENSMLYNGLL